MLNEMKVRDLVARFLLEDVGFGDLTAEIFIEAGTRASFVMNAREPMVVAGIGVARIVFEIVAADLNAEVLAKDGDRVSAGTALMRLTGDARGIVTAERNALNLVQHMSGIATLTAQYVDRLAGTKCQLLDTRKTTPGLRMLDKHAVQCGGGRNHRLALDGGVLVKDNHIAVCGSLTAAIQRAKARVPVLTKVEVECDTLDQVREALAAGADMLLLDNMSLDALREAVAIVGGRIPLEASGGVTLETIRPIAETGVDFVSVGRITQSAPAVDIGLDDA